MRAMTTEEERAETRKLYLHMCKYVTDTHPITIKLISQQASTRSKSSLTAGVSPKEKEADKRARGETGRT
jgi:hypothetical protein